MLVMNTSCGDRHLTHILLRIEQTSLRSCLSVIILSERLLRRLDCCWSNQCFHRIIMLAWRLKSALWTSPFVREGPLHSNSLCFDLDEPLLLILLIDLLIWNILMLRRWQSPTGLVRSLRLESGIQISVLDKSHLLLVDLAVVALMLTDRQRLLFIKGLELRIHTYWWLLVVIEMLSLCEEEAAPTGFRRGWARLLLLDS